MLKSANLTSAYRTRLGTAYRATIEDLLQSRRAATLRGKVDLIFTSPPFPLNTKKKYGNLQGEEYTRWLSNLAPSLRDLLKPDGSIVVEVGNSWEPNRPIMSTLALKSLLAFLEAGPFVLCQQFVYHNPARLPGPAQWVNVERIRVKDSFTHLWWMSTVDRPQANNRAVLTAYSPAMRYLLKTQTYTSGNRPSEHRIGSTSFLADNGGAIPSNVISLANTESTSEYLTHCRARRIKPHPARMPVGLAEFFIKFLTKAGDLVLDPFAGSNTSGAAAEALKRRWIAVEPNEEYIAGSVGRFASTR